MQRALEFNGPAQRSSSLAGQAVSTSYPAIRTVVADARLPARPHHQLFIAGARLPERREPCFCDPQHGRTGCRTSGCPNQPGGHHPHAVPVCTVDRRAPSQPATSPSFRDGLHVNNQLGAVAPGRQASPVGCNADGRLAKSGEHSVHGQPNLAQAYLNGDYDE